MKDPIRILHVIGELEVGGSQSLMLNIYRLIDRTKIQFDFIIDNPDANHLQSTVEKMGAKVYCLPKYNGFNYLEIRQRWRQFFKLHSEYKVLHSHVRSYASLFIPIAKQAGLQTIIHSHSTSEGYGLSAFLKRILEYPLRFQADYFFGCSNEAAIWLFGKNIINKKSYSLIKNGIIVDNFKFKIANRAKVRSQFCLDDKIVIGHVGRFVDIKNHKFIIKIFQSIKKESDNFKLLLVGDGPNKKIIETIVKDYGLIDDVIFVGESLKPEIYYSAMDMFIFPSKAEGLGISLVEAQCNGLSCIIADTIPKEAIITKDIGIFDITTTNKNYQKWAKYIIDNANNDERNIEENRLLGIKNTKDKGYDLKLTASQLEQFYLNIIDNCYNKNSG